MKKIEGDKPIDYIPEPYRQDLLGLDKTLQKLEKKLVKSTAVDEILSSDPVTREDIVLVKQQLEIVRNVLSTLTSMMTVMWGLYYQNDSN